MDFQKKYWQFRDLITEDELNRMEDGIEEGITKAEQAQDTADNAQNAIDNHIAATTGVHGATSAATPNTIVQRDSSGRIKAAAPSASDDVARKAEVDAITTEKINTTAYRPATEDGSTYPIGVTSFAVINGLSDGWPAAWGVVSTTKLSDIRCLQIFMASTDAGVQNGRVYVRSWRSDIGWSNWRRQWDDQEMGAGSGLDADKLDGMEPTTAATPNTIVQRDANGRFKAAAPSASDDVARKAEVDTVQNNLNSHKTAVVLDHPDGSVTTPKLADGAVTPEKLSQQYSTAINAGYNEDPNTTDKAYIITNHANAPIGGAFWHIRTFFYFSTTGNRAQFAIRYNNNDQAFIRYFYDGAWSNWVELETVAGAQAKANIAEQNAKNASLPRTGGTVTGTLEVASGYFDVGSFNVDTYGAGKMRSYYNPAGQRWNLSAYNESGVAVTLNLQLNSGPMIMEGNVNPEGNVVAPVGSIFMRRNGGSGTSFYVKESGTGNTGWRAK